MKKIKLTVEGMHCASCASNIERALKKVAGIKSVCVAILLNKVIIEAENNIDINEITKAISKVGYKVVKIE
ncbi:MAG: heavy metal-associated domain-containing protein [Nanoarchaeota archaeon]|nr:heavy metal-associated domain-containing protein [Nanoarchaeota archaeon]